MRAFWRNTIWLVVVSVGVLVRAAESPVLAPGAELKKLAGDFKFTEGPTSDSEGDVYFTDQPNDRILKWSEAGGLSTWKQPAGRANGMCFDRRANLFVCADEKMELWLVDGGGRKTVLASEYQGKPLNGPNDVWVHPDGGLFFTDPFYARPWWSHKEMPQDGQHVYYLSPHRDKLVRVVNNLEQPNGIVGSPDGRKLFVADIRAKKTYRFDIRDDGSLSNQTLFCEMGSDGMTLDREGNLYLTGRGVTVFNSKGKQVEHIDVPEGWTANVCFGGREYRTLFITASTGFYSIEMKVQGNGPGK
jgi:gluconolactonase